MQAWEASIDRQLAVRLARTGERPGVIRMALVRRILAGIAAMTERFVSFTEFNEIVGLSQHRAREAELESFATDFLAERNAIPEVGERKYS